MVRLIRMTSEDPTATFDNSISGDLVLEPYSQIALQNLSLEHDPEEFTVDDSNNQITFSVTNNRSYTATLTKAVYSASTFNDLMNDITLKMNAALPVLNFVAKENGVQYKAAVDSKVNKVNIQYQVGHASRFSDIIQNNTSFSPTNAAGVIQRVGGTGGSDSYLASDTPLCKGACVYQVKINAVNNSNTNTSYIIGLVKKEKVEPLQFNISDYDFGVAIGPSSNFIYQRVISPGTATPNPPSLTPQADDVIGVEITLGKIELVVYRSGTRYLLNSSPYDGRDYFPAMTFFGTSSDVSVKEMKMTQDPYLATPTSADDALTSGRPSSNNRVSINNLDFTDAVTLGKFLGYNNIENTIKGVTASFLAENLIHYLDLADSFIVELTSLELDSYDTFGVNGSRRSILATIPKSDKDNELIYEAPYLTFIDIKNKSPIMLRNIKARVLRNDLSTINTRGLTSMTVVVSSAQKMV